MLVKEKLISHDMVKKILSWKHSGFSAHAKVRLPADDKDGLKSLAENIVRSPVSEGKLIPSDDGHKVIYHDKLNPAKGKNFETYDTLEFLAALSTHIPARNRKVVIYYGWYSQPARGKRRRESRMRIISFIQERGLIERILKHLGLLNELHIHSPPAPKPPESSLVYEPFFDDLTQDEQIELAQVMN